MVETGNKFHDNVSRLVSWGHWFTFFNLILISLISLRYIKYAGLADTLLGIAYQFVSLVGHASFLCAMVFGIILFPMAFVVPFQRLYRLLTVLISTGALTLLIVDTQIFKRYSFHLNPLIWQFLQRPEQVEQIYSINLHYISIPIILAIELVISYYIWKKWRSLQAKAIGKPIAITLFTAFIITHLTFIWADATQYRPIVQQKSIYPLSYPMTARTFLTNQGWLNEEKLFSRMNQVSEKMGSNTDYLNYPKAPLIYKTPLAASQKNIMMISVGELRSDMLNTENMPFLYSLSEQGLNYQNHFSGANNRAQGIFSLFYGLPNRYWPEITSSYIPPILMERLEEQDYQLGLFSSIGFIHKEFLQSSFSEINTPELNSYSPINSNAISTNKWSDWIAKQSPKEKWFSFIYFEQEKNNDKKNAALLNLAEQTKRLTTYQQQVLEIDKLIKTIVSTLQKKGMLDNTIVLITGTHGKSFDNNSNSEEMISNAHVPLVILWPGMENPQQITRMTSHVDIVPTMMKEVLGNQNNAKEYTSGQSLFNSSARDYIISGAVKELVIYEKDKITRFSNAGEIESINWQGEILNTDDLDITVLIDVLSKLRRFN